MVTRRDSVPFKLIVGGKAANGELGGDVFREKLGALFAIERTLHQRTHLYFGPSDRKAFWVGIWAAWVVLLIVCAVAKMNQETVTLSFEMVLSILVLVWLTSFIAARPFLGDWLKVPLTFEAQLDEQLFQYDPVDTDAYRTLQDETARAGFLDDAIVKKWLAREFVAIYDADSMVPGMHRSHHFLMRTLPGGIRK